MAGDPKTLSKRIVAPIPVLTIAKKNTDSWSRRDPFFHLNEIVLN